MQSEILIVQLDDFGLLKVSGSDAKKFLQGQLTCDLETINPSQHSLGAHCHPQGRIISLFRLFQYQNDYYLAMPKNMVPLTITALKKYAIFYKVELADASDTFLSIGVCGKTPNELLQNTPSTFLTISLDSNRTIFLDKPDVIKLIWEKLAENAVIGCMNDWKYLDIQSGLPMIYPETTGKLLPHDLHLHELNGISLNKGCYTGQEIIARMHYRGKLKKHLYQARIKTNSLPFPGEPIYYHQREMTHEGGVIVDSCYENESYCRVLFVADEATIQNNFFLEKDQKIFFEML